MALLGREQLLKKDDLEREKVVFDDEDYVFVRQMTGRERDQWEASLLVKKRDKKGNISYEQNIADFRAKLAVHTVCDENGELIFKPEDYNALSENMSAKKLEQIVNVAQKLNLISDEDRENLTNFSEDDLSDNSTLDSV